MSEDDMFYCSFVSIHYIICECGETFPTEESLKIHLEKEHPYKRERKEYKCGVCESTFPTEQQCIEHYETTHIEIKQEHDYVGTENLQSPEPEHNETVYTYYEEGDYYEEIHEETATSVICEVCGELYLENTQHVCPVIVEVKDEEPTVCKPVERAKKNYDRTIVCEVCGKYYASNAALRYHQRLHTGERPYKCTMCNKTFTMPLFLQIHIRTHTGERPYVCTHAHCTKAFSNKAALLRHDRVHTGVKPYQCPQCGKSFTQSNSMKLHVHTVHLKMPAPYKSKSRRAKMRSIKPEKDIKQEVEDVKHEVEDIKRVEEDTTAVQNMVSSMPESLAEAEMQVLQPDMNFYQVQDGDVLYEEDIDKEVTYEIVYED